MSSLPLLGSGLGALEPVTGGGCWRVAVVAASIRLVGRFCRNVVEISGRIFIAIPFPPVVLTLAAWSGVGALWVMLRLDFTTYADTSDCIISFPFLPTCYAWTGRSSRQEVSLSGVGSVLSALATCDADVW